MSKNGNEMDPVKLREMVLKDKRERESNVAMVLKNVLDEYKCAIVPIVIIEGTNMRTHIKITALD